MDLPPYIRDTPGGACLALKIQPRASRDQITGPLGEALKIQITAPPVDSAANKALIQFLARKLRCPTSRIEIIKGQKSRQKLVRFTGLCAAEVAGKLQP